MTEDKKRAAFELYVHFLVTGQSNSNEHAFNKAILAVQSFEEFWTRASPSRATPQKVSER